MKAEHVVCAILFALAASDSRGAVHPFCVGDDAQLLEALAEAPARAQQDPSGLVDIRLQRKPGSHYTLTQAALTGSGALGNLRVRGGFSADPDDYCSEEARLIAPEETRIRHAAPLGAPPLQLHATGSLTFEGLALELDSGLHVTHDAEYAEIAFVSNRLSASNGDSALVIERVTGRGGRTIVRVVNNLVTGVGGSAGCAVELRNPDPGAAGLAHPVEAVVANNTIADNAGAGLCYRGVARLSLDNTIVWGNAAAIADTDPANPSPAFLRHNLLQPGSAIPGLQGSHEAGLSADPQFLADYRLDDASPAANSGFHGAVPGGVPPLDAAGNPRKIGLIDRGAFESAVPGAAGIVVNTTGDSIDGDPSTTSLREAIALANGKPGADRIVFDIALVDDCPALLFLQAPLPGIVDSLELDGFTQEGARPNAHEFEYDGAPCVSLLSAGLPAGLAVPAGADASLVVRGLQIAGFGTGVQLAGGRAHWLEGNVLGAEHASNGIDVGIGAGVTGSLVGGTGWAARNLLGSARNAAVLVAAGAYGNAIVGNVIGPRIDGIEDPGMKNHRGVVVAGTGNLVANNAVLQSGDTGIHVSGAANSLAGNLVALNKTGIRVGPLAGIGAATSNSLHGNELAYNAEAGIALAPKASRNRISAGSFYNNGGLAIDLLDNGNVEPNDLDVGVAPLPGSEVQNHPRLLRARLSGSDETLAQVEGVLESRNGEYILRFYASAVCDASGHGEGEDLVGSLEVRIEDATALQDGSVEFASPVRGMQPLGFRYVTATATDVHGNTSEFSGCRLVAPDALFGNGFE